MTGRCAMLNATAPETAIGKSGRLHSFFDDPGHNSVFISTPGPPPTTKIFGSRRKYKHYLRFSCVSLSVKTELTFNTFSSLVLFVSVSTGFAEIREIYLFSFLTLKLFFYFVDCSSQLVNLLVFLGKLVFNQGLGKRQNYLHFTLITSDRYVF